VSAIVHVGNVLDILPTLEAGSVNCVVTSPPYWGLRDYGTDGQFGLEPTPELYVANMVAVFREVRRILRDDGTLWLNLGDSYASTPPGNGKGFTPETTGLHGGRNSARYQKTMDSGAGTKRNTIVAGLKPKDLVGIPWTVALALRDDGWYLRSDIIWAKTSCMPESVRDRCTSSHEYLFMLTKKARYYYDSDAIAEPTDGRSWHDVTGSPRTDVPGQTKQDGHGRRHAGFNERYFSGPPPATRNKRDVWTIATQPYPEAHFATYPEKLVEPCVLAGRPVGGTVADFFAGSGTTGVVACRLGRNFVGIELNPEYAEMAERRIAPHRDQMQLAVTT